jgi:general secretion pathway protein L
MSAWHSTSEMLTRWTDAVAEGIIAALERFVSPRVVRLVEGEQPDTFTLQGASDAGATAPMRFAHGRFSGSDLPQAVKGSRVELVLQPCRFMVRPLELPARAAEFIAGIVRAQIDRLTPWTAEDAMFGCATPATSANGKIVTTIAAAPRSTADAYIAGLTALQPAAVSIFTRASDEAHELIKVFEQQTRGLLDRTRLSRALRTVLAAAAAAAVLSNVGSFLAGDYLDSRRAELNGEIAARRLALRIGGDGTDRSPIAMLARRKHEMQARVIAVDELSRILPDRTYVTELRIDGSSLQIVGVTDDAPSLIRLMEQSAHFSRATFFAPTTRAPSDPGDRFHIEARLEPANTVSR